MALAISFAAHAVAAVTIGAVLRATVHSRDVVPEPIQIDLAAPPSVEAAPAVADARPSVPERQAVSPSAPRRRPRAVDLSAAAPPQPASPSDEPVARFAMAAGTVAVRATVGTAGPAPAAGALPDAVAGERDVDAPARLLASSPLVYPQAARQAAIEIDFPVEIVVDAGGRVISARPLRHAGYGLDEAAIRAIRAYRFSPAIRAGRAVPVRMRWMVQFRLR